MSVDKPNNSPSGLSWFSLCQGADSDCITISPSSSKAYTDKKPEKSNGYEEITDKHVKKREDLKYLAEDFWNGDNPIETELRKISKEASGKEVFLATIAKNIPSDKLNFLTGGTIQISAIPESLEERANEINKQVAYTNELPGKSPSREV